MNTDNIQNGGGLKQCFDSKALYEPEVHIVQLFDLHSNIEVRKQADI